MASAWPAFDARPYLERQFDAAAFTCWHLVVEFYRNEFGIALPTYGNENYQAMTAVERAEAFQRARDDGLWQPVKTEQFGDVVTFADLRLPKELRVLDAHVGVVIARRTMLHVPEDAESEVVRFDGFEWGPRFRGLVRHRDRA